MMRKTNLSFAVMAIGTGVMVNAVAPVVIKALNKDEKNSDKKLANALSVIGGSIALGILVGTISSIQKQNIIILEKLSKLDNLNVNLYLMK